MTTIAPTTLAPRKRMATLGAVLAPMHEEWMQEVAVFLRPAVDEEADFWTRWAGVRFLLDRFGVLFQSECALLDAIEDRLSPEATGALATARTDLESTVEALKEVGRRRGTGVATARLARRLIDQLALWCVEVELATSRIGTDELPPDAAALLDHLEVVAPPVP